MYFLFIRRSYFNFIRSKVEIRMENRFIEGFQRSLAVKIS